MSKKRIDTFIVVLMTITGFIIGMIAGFSAKNDVENALTETTVSQETTKQTTVEETTEIELTTVKSEDILKLRELDRFKITGYTPTCKHCCGKTDCIGASGKKIVVGESVAMNRADMKSFGLEYGDKIYIEGIGERVIVDTGCDQGVIDVACDNHENCSAITGYRRVHYVIE